MQPFFSFFFFGVNSIIFNSLRSILLSILYSRSIFFFVFKFHRRSNKFVFVTANRRKQTELSQNIYRHIPKWMRRGNNNNNNKNATANTLDRFRLHSANRQILYFECGERDSQDNTKIEHEHFYKCKRKRLDKSLVITYRISDE